MRGLSHLDFAHQIWSIIVQPGDTCIDATAGNGLDSHQLAHLALQAHRGKLIAFDLQEAALKNTRERLKDFPQDRIVLHQMCHSKMAEVIEPGSAKIVVFNLGYLPGGDKSLTTRCESTLVALKASLDIVSPTGLISITCYPGHEEGEHEERAVCSFCETLDPKKFVISSHKFPYRLRYPHLLLIQRIA